MVQFINEDLIDAGDVAISSKIAVKSIKVRSWLVYYCCDLWQNLPAVYINSIIHHLFSKINADLPSSFDFRLDELINTISSGCKDGVVKIPTVVSTLCQSIIGMNDVPFWRILGMHSILSWDDAHPIMLSSGPILDIGAWFCIASDGMQSWLLCDDVVIFGNGQDIDVVEGFCIKLKEMGEIGDIVD